MFVTNFVIGKGKESVYKQAAKITGINHQIANNAYDINGNLIKNYKALHTDNVDLSYFWKEVRRIEDDGQFTKSDKK